MNLKFKLIAIAELNYTNNFEVQYLELNLSNTIKSQ